MDITPRSPISNTTSNSIEQPGARTPSSKYSQPSAQPSSQGTSDASLQGLQGIAYDRMSPGIAPERVASLPSRGSTAYSARDIQRSKDVQFTKVEPGAVPPRRNRRWKLYTAGALVLVGTSLALGLGLGLGLRKHHAGAAASGTGVSTGLPTVTVSPIAPLTTAHATTTLSATPTSSVVPSPTPTLAELQDPSFEPQPAAGDIGQQVGTWQPWAVSLFPAGLPTPGDVSSEEIPHSDTAATLRSLVLKYPGYVESLVQLRPNNTFQLTMADPQGNPIAVQVDNKFLTAADGDLLQVGSAGHQPTWATVMEKGIAKWATVFTSADQRNTFYGLSNVTSDDVLRAYVPSATVDGNGTVSIPGVSATDPKVATQSAIAALSQTFNGLPVDNGRQATFNRAVSAALAGDATTLKGAIADFRSDVANAGLKEVAAYDNIVTGLTGILGWIAQG